MNVGQLWESLTTSGTAPLIAKSIDPHLLELVRKMDPWETFFPTTAWGTNTYFWDTRSGLPTPQHVVEAPPTTGTGSVTASSSTYNQLSFTVKHYQSNGDLSKFAQKVSTVALDAGTLLAGELKSHTKAMRFLRTATCLYGSALSTPDVQAGNGSSGTWRPQWTGISNQIDSANVLTPNAGASGTVSLRDLDNAIDAVTVLTGADLGPDSYAFVYSQPMGSEIQRLFGTSMRVMAPTKMVPYRGNLPAGQPVVAVDGGFECLSYRGIPILESSFMSPAAVGTMSAITATENTGLTTGSVGTGAVYYQVRAITQYGRTIACAEATVTPGTATHAVDLTFTAPSFTDAFGNAINILGYEVYKSHTTGHCTLYGIVGAYDGLDQVVGTTANTGIRDYGTSLAVFSGTGYATTNGTYGYAGKYLGAGTASGAAANQEGDTYHLCSTNASAESIFLISRNPDYLIVPEVTSIESEILAPVNYRTVQYAVGGDCCLAMRTGKFAAEIVTAKTN